MVCYHMEGVRCMTLSSPLAVNCLQTLNNKDEFLATHAHC
jgi:hypothetical protein